MSERARAITLATWALDRPNADPDDDLSVVSRQFLRCLDAGSHDPSAPPSTDPGIDVERLARALVADDNNDPEMWDLYGEAARSLARKHAARIAAEYAPLASQAKEPDR